MPVMYAHKCFNCSIYATLRTGVKLTAPVFDLAKAISGIRTHVFESEEYKVHTEHKKVRSNYT